MIMSQQDSEARKKRKTNSGQEERVEMNEGRRKKHAAEVVAALVAPMVKSLGKADLAKFAREYQDYVRRWKDADISRKPATMLSCFNQAQLRVVWKIGVKPKLATVADLTEEKITNYVKTVINNMGDYDRLMMDSVMEGVSMDLKVKTPDARVLQMLERLEEVKAAHGYNHLFEGNRKLEVKYLVKAVRPKSLQTLMKTLTKQDSSLNQDPENFIEELLKQAERETIQYGSSRKDFQKEDDRRKTTVKEKRDPKKDKDIKKDKPKPILKKDGTLVECYKCGGNHPVTKCSKAMSDEKRELLEKARKSFKKVEIVEPSN